MRTSLSGLGPGAGARKARQKRLGRRQHLQRRERFHAPMIEWAHPKLARTAVYLFLQVDRLGVIGLRPGDMRWSIERYHRPVKGSGEMARPTVRRDQEI